MMGRYWYETKVAKFFGFLLFAAVVAGALFLLDNAPPPPSDIREQKIRQCIADGGDPEYAFSRGVITDYFGCVKHG